MVKRCVFRCDKSTMNAGVTEQLVDCSGGEEITLEAGQKRKLDALADLLLSLPVPRTIVFCNKIETCRAVENFLNRRDVQDPAIVLPCHAAIAPGARQKNLVSFLSPPQAGESPLVLVCTDRLASMCLDVFCLMFAAGFHFIVVLTITEQVENISQLAPTQPGTVL